MVKKIACGGFTIDDSVFDLEDDVLTIKGLTDKSIVINSSTAGSTKRFAITVTDDGTIKATEIE